MSIWRIAAAVFIGNVLWAVIGAVLYFCFSFALGMLLASATR